MPLSLITPLSSTLANANEQMMGEFWWFITERQNIWWKRHNKQLPPWTTDKVVRGYFFCNVYRELDPGTHIVTKMILALPDDTNMLFNLWAYRLFNSIETYIHLSQRNILTYGNWDWKAAALDLTEWESHGNRVFTDAFTVTGVKFGGYPDKVRNICSLIAHLQKEAKDAVQAVKGCSSLKELYDLLYTYEGFGRFLAYQIAIDLSYTKRLGSFDKDGDWVMPGPGCRVGLRYIFPNAEGYQFPDLVKYLRDKQKTFFKVYGLTFKHWKYDHIPLSDIQNCLCEFSKYARIKFNKKPDGSIARGRTRRYVLKTEKMV